MPPEAHLHTYAETDQVHVTFVANTGPLLDPGAVIPYMAATAGGTAGFFPAPAPAAVPHESHKAMSARTGVPTAPCPQIRITLFTYQPKKTSCWKVMVSAQC